MCGIFGYYNNNIVGDDFRRKMILSMGFKADANGKDSWGVGFYKKIRDKKQFYVQKGLGYFYENVKADKKSIKSWIASETVIGHSRSASKGAITLQNAHPFIIGDWCCIHNGCHYTLDKFGKSLWDYMPQGETDSELIFCYLLENGMDYDAFQEISGWYNSVMFNYKTNEICFFTNGERMWLLKLDEGIVFASTEDALLPIHERKGGTIEQLKSCAQFYNIVDGKLVLVKSHNIEQPKKYEYASTVPTVLSEFKKLTAEEEESLFKQYYQDDKNSHNLF